MHISILGDFVLQMILNALIRCVGEQWDLQNINKRSSIKCPHSVHLNYIIFLKEKIYEFTTSDHIDDVIINALC